MMCLVITQPGRIEEMNLSGQDPYLVMPVPTPPVYAIADRLPPIVEAYPTVMLRRHVIEHPQRGERFTCYWPDSWRDEWALAEFERWRVVE